jgi:hypothetical protein
MNTKAILIAVLSLAMVAAGYGLVQAHGSRGWSDYDRGYGHMGSGGHMMDYRGGYGQGMMGYGGNYRGHMMDYRDYQPCWDDGRTRVQADITQDSAKKLVEDAFTRNPNLKVGKVKQTDDGFEVQVVTKKGEALVDRLLVEKDTGRVYRIYE